MQTKQPNKQKIQQKPTATKPTSQTKKKSKTQKTNKQTNQPVSRLILEYPVS